jgi:tetratricopeptide (TPR) repeat protein
MIQPKLRSLLIFRRIRILVCAANLQAKRTYSKIRQRGSNALKYCFQLMKLKFVPQAQVSLQNIGQPQVATMSGKMPSSSMKMYLNSRTKAFSRAEHISDEMPAASSQSGCADAPVVECPSEPPARSQLVIANYNRSDDSAQSTNELPSHQTTHLVADNEPEDSSDRNLPSDNYRSKANPSADHQSNDAWQPLTRVVTDLLLEPFRVVASSSSNGVTNSYASGRVSDRKLQVRTDSRILLDVASPAEGDSGYDYVDNSARSTRSRDGGDPSNAIIDGIFTALKTPTRIASSLNVFASSPVASANKDMRLFDALACPAIKFSYFAAFLGSLGGKGTVAKMTMTDVATFMSTKCADDVSWCEHLFAQYSSVKSSESRKFEQGPSQKNTSQSEPASEINVGEADYYVCYSPTQLFIEVLESLYIYLQHHYGTATMGDVSVYIDIFSLCRSVRVCRNLETGVQRVQQTSRTIQHIGHVLCVFGNSFSEPACLKQCWCFFELFVAATAPLSEPVTGSGGGSTKKPAKFEILVTNSEGSRFQACLNDNNKPADAFLSMLANLKFHACSSTHPGERDAIMSYFTDTAADNAISRLTGSKDPVGQAEKIILNFLQCWLVQHIEDHIAHTCQAGRMLQAMNWKYKLALIFMALRRNDDAVLLLKECLAFYESNGSLSAREESFAGSVVGGDGNSTAAVSSCLLQLSNVYKHMNMFTEAENALDRMLSATQRNNGSEHSSSVAVMLVFVDLYKDMLAVHEQTQKSAARPSVSITIQKEAAASGALSKMPGDLQNTETLINPTEVYAKLESLLKKVLDIQERTLGLESPHTTHTCYMLALFYRSQKRYSVCEGLLLRALTQMEKYPNHLREYESQRADKSGTSIQQSTAFQLASVYERCGKHDLAEKLLVRYLAICSTAYGVENEQTLKLAARLKKLRTKGNR